MKKQKYKLFSETEKELIKLLSNERVTIHDLSLGLYGVSEMEGQNKTAGVIRRVARKCAYYKLDWTISGEGVGRTGRTVWKTKTNNKE